MGQQQTLHESNGKFIGVIWFEIMLFKELSLNQRRSLHHGDFSPEGTGISATFRTIDTNV
jgi:hypothetical protein